MRAAPKDHGARLGDFRSLPLHFLEKLRRVSGLDGCACKRCQHTELTRRVNHHGKAADRDVVVNASG